jgi:adenylate cyclase
MPSNIEIKARVVNPGEFRMRAELLSDTAVMAIPQEDIFFPTKRGRLKLRILTPDFGQLVYYTRPDATGPKRSDYQICDIGKPGELKTLLARSLGVRGIVRKTRYLYMAGQTRIHLDEVEGLGTFMELEVVLHPGQGDEAGLSIAEGLMRRLGVHSEDLVEGAYIDLIEKTGRENL